MRSASGTNKSGGPTNAMSSSGVALVLLGKTLMTRSVCRSGVAVVMTGKTESEMRSGISTPRFLKDLVVFPQIAPDTSYGDVVLGMCPTLGQRNDMVQMPCVNTDLFATNVALAFVSLVNVEAFEMLDARVSQSGPASRVNVSFFVSMGFPVPIKKFFDLLRVACPHVLGGRLASRLADLASGGKHVLDFSVYLV